MGWNIFGSESSNETTTENRNEQVGSQIEDVDGAAVSGVRGNVNLNIVDAGAIDGANRLAGNALTTARQIASNTQDFASRVIESVGFYGQSFINSADRLNESYSADLLQLSSQTSTNNDERLTKIVTYTLLAAVTLVGISMYGRNAS